METVKQIGCLHLIFEFIPLFTNIFSLGAYSAGLNYMSSLLKIFSVSEK